MNNTVNCRLACVETITDISHAALVTKIPQGDTQRLLDRHRSGLPEYRRPPQTSLKLPQTNFLQVFRLQHTTDHHRPCYFSVTTTDHKKLPQTKKCTCCQSCKYHFQVTNRPISWTFLPHDDMLAWYMPLSSVCLCVCVSLSVTLRYCIKMAKRTITQIIRRKTCYNSKTVKDRSIVSIKVE